MLIRSNTVSITKLTFFLGIFFLMTDMYSQIQCPPGGALFINEFSGAGASEYIEMVVVGDPANPTAPVNLEGWIIDDNSYPMAGVGTTQGHMILGSCFSSMLPGSIIVIYDNNNVFPGINPGFPNSDGAYVVAHNDPCIIVCSSNPNWMDGSFIPCNTFSYVNWFTSLALNNTNDGMQTRFPNADFYHGLYYGLPAGQFGPGNVPGCLDIGNNQISLDCGNWFDAGNFSNLTPSPGLPNSALNEVLINRIAAGLLDCNDFSTACILYTCPEIDDLSFENDITGICIDADFGITASGLANMAQIVNGEADFGVRFVFFPGSTTPADPYIGGTDIDIIPYNSLSGAHPNQSAATTHSFAVAGDYSICAVLEPEFTQLNDCAPFACSPLNVFNSFTASLSGTHEFCPGDCHEINTVITGGTEPYTASFTLTVWIFNIPFTVPAYDVNNQLTICYSGDDPIPSYNQATNILTIPWWITGTGTLTLNSIVDGDGCEPETIDPNFTTLTFKGVLDIFEAGPLEECDYDFDGSATFDLTVLNDQVTGGQANSTAEWFEDADCTIAINTPGSFTTPSTTVYVFVSDDTGDLCNSDTIEVDLIVINIPNPGSDNTLSACNDDPCVDVWSYLGPDAQSGGTWDNGGSGLNVSSNPSCVNFSGSTPGNYQFTYTTQDAGGQCAPQSAVLTVTISEPGNPGQDNEDIFCGPPVDPVNLLFYLNNDYDPGGNWTSSGSFNLSNPAVVDMSGATTGTHYFYYTIENIPCDPVTSTITIEIIDEPNPGTDGTVVVCNTGTNTVVNLENELGPHDPGGDWYDPDFNYVFNPTYVDFTGFATGAYEYTYWIPETDICPLAIAVITVVVQEGANAGKDSTYHICQGSDEIIDLPSLLGEHDPGGNWTQVTGQAVSLNNPNNVSFADKTWGVYNFDYNVSGGCGSDVATITIVIDRVLVAGDDYQYEICQNSGVNLFDSLKNYDFGGFWINENNVPVNSNQVLAEAKTYIFRYVQTENEGCPNDTAYAVIDIIPLPFAGNDNTFLICEGDSEVFDLFSYLGSDYDTTGTWLNTNNGVIVSVSNQVVFTNSPVGLDTFLYIVTGECGSDTATVIANITSSPSAGDDYDYDVCRYQQVNLFDSLQNYSAGGIWSDENGFVVNDPGSVFLDSPGTYTFKYSIPASGACLADSAYAVINVLEPPLAGTGQDFSICQESVSIVNLFNYIEGGYFPGGSWSEGTNNIAEPNTHDLSAYLPGIYNFTYTVPSNNICPGSSTSLTMTVVARPNPGANTMAEVCNSDINTRLNFEELIGTHDSGGSWKKFTGNPVNISTPQNVNFAGIPIGIYSFFYLIEDQGICPADSSEIRVEVFSKLNAGNNRTRTFCLGDNIRINILNELGPDPGTETIIEDVGQTGALNPDTYEIDISQLSLGTYIFILSVGQEHICGPDSSRLTINVVNAPNAGNDNQISVCNNESGIDLDALLGVHDEGGIWSDMDDSGVQIQSSQGKNISFENVTQGTYRYMYMHQASGSCPETSAVITVNVNPVSSESISRSICPGENLIVNGNIYDLSTPSGIEIMTNSFGCDSIITIELSEKIISAQTLVEDENCFGSGRFNINNIMEASLPATLTINGTDTYQISALPYTVNDISSGTYNYEITDQNGCSISGQTFDIGEFVPFNIEIQMSNMGNSYRLEVVTDIIPQNIVWTPAEGLSCTDCLVTTARPASDQLYIVEITDSDGCTVSDEILLRRLVDLEIYIPNVFTPDGDGINERFYARCNDCDQNYSMIIFDRWGEKMYEAKDIRFNDQGAGWDGTFRGRKASAGVYVFVIETELKNEIREVITGDVLILK
jgi:gliding motility-associated-like protein